MIINKNITILGNGYTLNAKNKVRIFHITGTNVTLDNLKFTNGRITGAESVRSGAIEWSGKNLTISNSLFDQNFAYGSAGAIYLSGTNAIITNSPRRGPRRCRRGSGARTGSRSCGG